MNEIFPIERDLLQDQLLALDQRMEHLRQGMDSDARLCVYLVNGDRLMEAYETADRYFGSLEDWTELGNARHRLGVRLQGALGAI